MEALSKQKPQISILFFLFSVTNILGLLYTAALPDLTKAMGITKHEAQQTIALFLLGFALAQLVYGPVSNALGRKIALYIGQSLAILGSLICLLSVEMNSFSLLLLGRIITAFGASSGTVLTSIMISDVYTQAEAKKKISHLMSGFAIIPALSIALGGYITAYFSWTGCFYFMCIYSVFIMSLSAFLPETIKAKEMHHLKIKTIAKHYNRQIRNLLLIICSIMMACAGVTLYVFSAEAPFIALHSLKMSPASFGLYNLIPCIGLLSGGCISAGLSHRLSSQALILLGGCFFFIPAVAMLIFFKMGFVNMYTLFVIPLLIYFSMPMIFANCSALAIYSSEDKPYASSLMNALWIFLLFLVVASLSLFPSTDPSVLPLVYMLSGGVLIVLWFVLNKIDRVRAL